MFFFLFCYLLLYHLVFIFIKTYIAFAVRYQNIYFTCLGIKPILSFEKKNKTKRKICYLYQNQYTNNRINVWVFFSRRNSHKSRIENCKLKTWRRIKKKNSHKKSNTHLNIVIAIHLYCVILTHNSDFSFKHLIHFRKRKEEMRKKRRVFFILKEMHLILCIRLYALWNFIKVQVMYVIHIS